MILGFMGCFPCHVSYQNQLCKIGFRLFVSYVIINCVALHELTISQEITTKQGCPAPIGPRQCSSTAILERKLKIGKERQQIRLVPELKTRFRVSARFLVNLSVLYDNIM